MSVTTIHQSKIIEEYNQKSDSEKLEILNKAFNHLQKRSYGTKESCICIALGYTLFSLKDNTWFKSK